MVYNFKFDIGQKVKIPQLGCYGKVTKIEVDGKNIHYQIFWWDRGEVKSAWLNELYDEIEELK